MISKFAEELYDRAVELKKFDSRKLCIRKNRLMLKDELTEMQKAAGEILSALCDNTDYSDEYRKLALFMNESLAECMILLTCRKKKYREKNAWRIWGFHNLPRAFFPADNPMKTTPAEAMKYYKPYAK